MHRFRRALLSAVLLFIAGCASVPLDYPRTDSQAIPISTDTRLGELVDDWQREHPGQSGFLPLPRGLDGLGARLRMLDLAEVSVDAQYFLIKPDEAGRLFLGKLLRAADRGVRVRLLIDDVFTPRDDHTLATLDSHPNIEIRLFNPLSRGAPAFWSMLTEFARTNRRMHNKAFLVDGAMGIVGGRNIAAEYFELNPDGNFDDFEVLVAGQVIEELQGSFDSFWNSRLSPPMEALGVKAEPEKLAEWSQIMQEVVNGTRPSAYERAVNSAMMGKLRRGEIQLTPAASRLAVDPPQKLKTARDDEQHRVVANALYELLDSTQREVTILTPYFLPRERGRNLYREAVQNGIRVRVITNSLASTNHVPVHAHYSKYRAELLRAGVEIYELRADRQPGWQENTENDEDERITLHTKAFEVDGDTLVLGSVNLDPRSIEINTELILIIDSPTLAGQLNQFVNESLADYTWRLALDEKGRTRWHYDGAGGPETYTREPGAGFWRRFQAGFYRLLPIEGQL